MDDLLSNLAISDNPHYTEIISSELEFERQIGSGGFGTVFKGSWNKTVVAIKVFTLEGSIRPRQAAIQKEVETWAKLRHPHVLRQTMSFRNPAFLSPISFAEFLGASIDGANPFIVMQYLENGNARDFIESHPECNRNKILHDVSLGLVYLHRRNVVHGDIKGFNVLIDGAHNAVLCDFGIARLKDDILSTSMGSGERLIVGTPSYMPPERLEGGSLQKPCDVYAFGMLVYEVHANANPLNLYVGYTEFMTMVVEGRRPKRPDRDEAPQMTDDIWRLAESCWEGTASLRPSIDDVCDRIAPSVKLYANFPANAFPWHGDPPAYVPKPSAYDRLRAGATFRERNTITTSYQFAWAVTMPHDGKTIASSKYSRDKPSIEIWDLASGALVRSLHGHTDAVTRLAFFKNGPLVSGSWDKTVRVWNLASSTATMILKHDKEITCISLSGDNKTIATGCHDDASIHLWDAMTGDVTHTLVDPACTHIRPVSISSDNSSLMTIGYNFNKSYSRATLWKSQPDGQWISDVRREIRCPKTKMISVSATVGISCSSSVPRLALNGDNRTAIYDFHGNETSVDGKGRVRLSPDGNWLAVRVDALRIWDAASGRMLSVPFQLTHRTYEYNDIFISHDGSTIVVGDGPLLHILVLTDS